MVVNSRGWSIFHATGPELLRTDPEDTSPYNVSELDSGCCSGWWRWLVGGEATLNLPQDLMVTMVCSHVFLMERPDVILNNIHGHIQDGWFAMVCHGLRGSIAAGICHG